MPALCRVLNAVDAVSTSRYTVGVYDVGSRADIAAEWALSCKEYRDDSSRACEAGDVGWASILKMADTCIALLRRSIAAPVPLCT